MDSDELHGLSAKSSRWPFWRSAVLLACGGLGVMGIVTLIQAVGPTAVSLFSTKPFDYSFVRLKAEDGIESVRASHAMDGGGFLVATMPFDPDTGRANGGVRLGAGPCDARDRTWSEGWMAVHSAGTGTVLPIPRGHCWDAALIGGGEEAVLWVLLDRQWWQPKARMQLTWNTGTKN